MATRSLNKVQLIGNLTRDVELRYTSSGTPVASFGVATNRSYTDSSGNNVETAEFTNIVVWSKLAEICAQLLKKGIKVFIEGRLQTSSWDDKETGRKMQRTEVVATDMIILSPPSGSRPSGSSGYQDNSGSQQDKQKAQGDKPMGEDVDFADLDAKVKKGKKEKEQPASDDSTVAVDDKKVPF